MNEKIILNMVKPYLINNGLLYSNFIRIFNMLSVKEQCSVSDILEKNGITIFDVDDEMENNIFEILYDSSLSCQHICYTYKRVFQNAYYFIENYK